MADIKTKKKFQNKINNLDKSVIVTQKTKDNIVNIKEKGESSYKNEDNQNASQYATNQLIGYTKATITNSKKIKDSGNNAVINTRDRFIKAKVKIKNIKTKLAKKKHLKTAKKGIKTSEKVAKKEAKKVAKNTLKNSEKAVKVMKNTVKVTAKTIKLTVKAIISSVKAIINATKALIELIIAGGWIAIIVIIVICLIGLLCSSIYGIFFSSENIGNSVTMSHCIEELNIEMDNRIKEIENNTPHDEIVIESNKAEWKDVLAIYTIKVSNNNKNEVITIDDNKKAILRQIFWDMNSLSNEVITEVYNEDNSIDYLGNRKESIEKRVLHIRINSKKVNEMSLQYNFNKNQINQLAELTNEKNQSLWNYAIYGNYSSSGKSENWKQYGESWSSIRLGNSNHTIKSAGCLVTSIAILIKKSGVSTNGISPFNPGTFVIALNNIYGFDSSGCLKYAPISNLVPHFKYAGRVNLSGKSKIDKLNEIKRYYSSGYYLAIKVIDTDNAQHWVALDEIKGDTILMSDPGSKSTNLWQEYDWNNTTQFVYFKAEK